MKQWQLWCEQFNQLQQREKLLIWGGSLVLTLWLVLIYLLNPMWQDVQKTAQQSEAMQRQMQDTQALALELREQLSVDMDKEYRGRVELLQQQQQQLNEQIRQSASHFIGAEQMITLLQNVLQQSQAVQVKSLHSSEPVAVKLPGQTAEEAALLFEHKLTLVVAGNYDTLYQVLQKIEQLPWMVNWSGLQYQVTGFPMAELTLFLGTVSENEDFIRL
jgi:MSHA biogenesis protein MshJ